MLPFMDKLQSTITGIYVWSCVLLLFLIKSVFLFFSFKPK